MYSRLLDKDSMLEVGRHDGASASAHLYSGESAVTVPDAHLLFSGEFKRAGSDLVITGEHGDRFVVSDYFAGERRAALQSPEGAVLARNSSQRLAGPVAPGQTAEGAPALAAPGPAATAAAIGRVETVPVTARWCATACRSR